MKTSQLEEALLCINKMQKIEGTYDADSSKCKLSSQHGPRLEQILAERSAGGQWSLPHWLQVCIGRWSWGGGGFQDKQHREQRKKRLVYKWEEEQW